MRAAVLREVGQSLSIEEVDTSPLHPREVLVQVAAAGLCHSDLHFIDGEYETDLPAVLGHESAGVVEEVGDQVQYVAPGDHVITCLSVFCGECDHCTRGRPNLCVQRDLVNRASGEPSRLHQRGRTIHQCLNTSSFAEKQLVHERAVVKVRDEMPLDRAALIGCSVTTGLGTVFRTAGVRPGESVVVIGCGGVGLAAVQGARIAGANQIIAVDRVAPKLDLARHVGATDAIDTVDAVAAVLDMTGGVHHAFEAAGTPATAKQGFLMLRPGGTLTIMGLIPGGRVVELPGDRFFAERKVQGSALGSNRFRTDMPQYVDMYLDGRLLLDEMISERIGLEDVNRGFARMGSGEHARSVIMFE